MTIHAFIFARGGSKGLPRKNIRDLAGKPLIAYSIEAARSVPEISEVFVSTEDAEIARVALAHGAKIIYRPPELARDDTPEWLAWRHAVEWTRLHHGEFSGFVSLPCTSPLRSPSDIRAAIVRLAQTGADICISVTPASRSPFFNMVITGTDGEVQLVSKLEGKVERRQDAPPVFDITTVVYATRPDFILQHYGIFSGRAVSIEVPKERAVDIDDIYDFKLAEAILSLRETT